MKVAVVCPDCPDMVQVGIWWLNAIDLSVYRFILPLSAGCLWFKPCIRQFQGERGIKSPG
ncbi:hypothetical protein [Leptodesmis sichuanensis]|uniref:hypothetical protein n=1 Tax=Leptodesmis sichuanensis TaxID=2906798 RepID=UPI001F266AF6|nr:hypothetical protein [Leptodesmis sichuanensis]